jgi:hypothetical protein
MSTTPTGTTKNFYKPLISKAREEAMSDSQEFRGGRGYILTSMMLVAIVGMAIKIFFTSDPVPSPSDGNTGPANAVIYGYGIVALAVITVLFISYGVHDRIGKIENKGTIMGAVKLIKQILTSSAPSIITIVILLWVISLNVTYYTQINRGTVADEYYLLSTGTSYLFVFQLTTLFMYLKAFIDSKLNSGKTSADKSLEQQDKTQNMLSFATYFLAMMNLIIAGMMTIILQFFSTDG